MKFVTTLALSHCDIETVEDGAFEGMEALSEIKLESNKLQYLQGTSLFPKHLNHIEVRVYLDLVFSQIPKFLKHSINL